MANVQPIDKLTFKMIVNKYTTLIHMTHYYITTVTQVNTDTMTDSKNFKIYKIQQHKNAETFISRKYNP